MKTWFGIDLFKFITALLIRTLEVRLFRMIFTTALVAVGAFAVALSFRFDCLSRVSLELRKLSVGIYLLHCPFILSFDFYLRRGTLVDFPVTLAFCFIAYYSLTRIMPQLSSVLFGYPSRPMTDRKER